MSTCLECSKSIVSGDLCKFCKCFTKASLVNYNANKQALQQEVSMSTDLIAKRIQYMEIVVKEGEYSYEEAAEMTMVELRDVVDTLHPLTITNASMTMRGGKTRKVTVVRKSA